MKKVQKRNHILYLTSVFILLSVVGLLNLYSAGADSGYFASQLKHMGIGFFVFVFIGWLVPIRLVNVYSYVLLGIVIVSLFVVLVLGHSAGGAQRWISIGPIRFQPSEIAKLAIAMGVAKFFYNNFNFHTYSLRDLSPVLTAILLVFVLIFEQPDFGTAGVCLMIACAQLMFVRIKISFKMILSLAALGVISMIAGWQFFLRPYQKLRILNLLNPNMDPSGSGYNSLQSLIAVGSGKQFGKGFLQGTQTQLQFLPARHTDFIFSVFAEEHGFWGCALVFFLFSALSYLALEIARDTKDIFSSLLAIGISALIYIEFTINVAMVLGLFPVVGMPLPFFSYGGTALVTMCVGLGLLVSIERETCKGVRSGRLDAI